MGNENSRQNDKTKVWRVLCVKMKRGRSLVNSLCKREMISSSWTENKVRKVGAEYERVVYSFRAKVKSDKASMNTINSCSEMCFRCGVGELGRITISGDGSFRLLLRTSFKCKEYFALLKGQERLFLERSVELVECKLVVDDKKHRE